MLLLLQKFSYFSFEGKQNKPKTDDSQRLWTHREREHARAHQHYIGKFPFLAFPFNCLWPCYVFVLVFFCFVSFRSLLLRFSCCRCRDGQTNLWKRNQQAKNWRITKERRKSNNVFQLTWEQSICTLSTALFHWLCGKLFGGWSFDSDDKWC